MAAASPCHAFVLCASGHHFLEMHIPARSLVKLSVEGSNGLSPHLVISSKDFPNKPLAEAYGDLFMGEGVVATRRAFFRSGLRCEAFARDCLSEGVVCRGGRERFWNLRFAHDVFWSVSALRRCESASCCVANPTGSALSLG